MKLSKKPNGEEDMIQCNVLKKVDGHSLEFRGNIFTFGGQMDVLALLFPGIFHFFSDKFLTEYAFHRESIRNRILFKIYNVVGFQKNIRNHNMFQSLENLLKIPWQPWTHFTTSSQFRCFHTIYLSSFQVLLFVLFTSPN